MSELEMSLETATTALATKTVALAAAEQKVTEAENFVSETKTRLAEAKELGLSIDVAYQMVEAASAEEASRIAIDAKQSTGATTQVDAIDTTQNDGKMSLLEYARQNKIK